MGYVLQGLYHISEITSLVTDMHSSADRIIELFSGTAGADDMSTRADRSLACNPAKLCYVVKQAIREAAIGECFTALDTNLEQCIFYLNEY